MPESLIKYLEKIIFFIIKGVIFLLPLFFLPWSGEHFEFNKLFLLSLLMPTAGLLWLIKEALGRRLKYRTNSLNLPIFIFLCLAAAMLLLFGLGDNSPAMAVYFAVCAVLAASLSAGDSLKKIDRFFYGAGL